jgi:hypothetical protein
MKKLRNKDPDAMLRPITAYITYQHPNSINLLMRLSNLENWDASVGK